MIPWEAIWILGYYEKIKNLKEKSNPSETCRRKPPYKLRKPKNAKAYPFPIIIQTRPTQATTLGLQKAQKSIRLTLRDIQEH